MRKVILIAVLSLMFAVIAFAEGRVVVDSDSLPVRKNRFVDAPAAVVPAGEPASGAAAPAPAAPALPPNQPQLLKGSFCYWHGSSSSFGSSSTTKWAKFDGQRKFTYGRTFMYSGSSGSYTNHDPVKGGIYEVRGDWVLIRYDEGGDDSAKVSSRAPDGTITSLTYNNQLYSPSLCQ